MLHVGLTGGLASGKSTVAALLADLGAAVIDADRIAREVVEPGTPGLASVVDAFGEQVLRPDGGLDRAALAQRVFGDDAARTVLNGIVHPLVRQTSAARVAALPEDSIVVHDVPLIVENDMAAQFHLVVIVAASAELRTRRAVERGLTEEAALARIAAQADDDARHAAADVWLPNESSETELRDAVEMVWQARLLPFAENLRARRPGAATPLPAAAAAHGGWEAQAARIIARLVRAAGSALGEIRCVPPDDPAPDVLDLRARPGTRRLEPDTLLDAGFVDQGEGAYGSADPGRPAELLLEGDPAG